MMPMRTARPIAVVMLASCLLFVSLTARAADEPTAAPLAAKWAPRKIHFMYTPVAPSNVTTYYSCDKLQAQLTTILKQLGARDAVVKPFGCATNGGPERFAGVDATFSVLEPAGSSDQAPVSSDNVQAHWDQVTLRSGASCDLIEQVKREILPLFTTRNPSSGCSPRFNVEVLRPIKAPAAHS
jgi:hypothetical protein